MTALHRHLGLSQDFGNTGNPKEESNGVINLLATPEGPNLQNKLNELH